MLQDGWTLYYPYILYFVAFRASNQNQIHDSDPSGMWTFVHTIRLATETKRGNSQASEELRMDSIWGIVEEEQW